MKIQVLTIKQPYVDLILDGAKTLEIRSWKTKYRGRLYIQSSQKPVYEDKYSGYILGYVDLVDIRPMTKRDKKKACTDFQDNQYAWILAGPQKIKPIAQKGQLGIFGIYLKEAVKRL